MLDDTCEAIQKTKVVDSVMNLLTPKAILPQPNKRITRRKARRKSRVLGGIFGGAKGVSFLADHGKFIFIYTPFMH